MRVIKTCFEKIEKLLHAISYISTFIMMFLITVDTAGRYLFNKPIKGAYEITESFLMIVVVFLTLSYSYKSGDHIRIDILYRRFTNKTKIVIDAFSLILSACMFSVITYYGWTQTYEAFIQKQYTFGVITMPMFLSYIWIPIGCGALTIRLFAEGIIDIGKLFGAKELIKEKKIKRNSYPQPINTKEVKE